MGIAAAPLPRKDLLVGNLIAYRLSALSQHTLGKRPQPEIFRDSGLEYLLDSGELKHPDIPIVLIAAHADETSRQRALKGGAIDFLGKPVRRETLFRAIQSAIER